MENKESNNKAEKKTHMGFLSRIRPITFVSLLFGIATLSLSLLNALFFYFYIETGGLSQTAASIWPYLSLLWPLLLFATFILALIALVIAVFKKPRLINLILVFITIILSESAHFIYRYTCFGFSFDTTRVESIRYYARSYISLKNFNWLKQTLQKYAKENEGKLPPSINWCDTLIAFEPNVPSEFMMGAGVPSKGRIRYGLNKNLENHRLADLPSDVVLLFETIPGNNPVGAHESITADNHYGKGCIVLFGDLHLGFVKSEDFNDLRWEP